jgi:RimJ/RimL family protein N-acetyltransferase
MTEAASAVIDWLTDAGTRHVEWECVPGNTASASVARKLGFAFAGTGPSLHPARDGSAAVSWHGTLFTNDRSEKPGWPA